MKFVNKNSDAVITAEACLNKRSSAQPPIILDIRTEEEYNKEHLIGAHSLPADQIMGNLSRLPPFAEIILYGEEDSETVPETVALLKENNFERIFYVNEGLSGLLAALRKMPGETFLADFPKEEWPKKIEEVLNSKIRPALASDGGGLTLIKTEDERVYINYEGACRGCASSTTGTLRFIQNTLSISLNKELEVVSA